LSKNLGFGATCWRTLELAVFQNSLGGNSLSIIATYPEIDTCFANKTSD
jgi:hypothetical protein